MCGKCSIGKIRELAEKRNMHFSVATGGTLARQIVREYRPQAIVAIACERDLISGMPLDAAVKALESAGYSAGTIANIDNSKDTNQAQVTMQSADGSNPNVINLNVEYNKTTADDKNNNQEAPGTTHTGTVNISVPAGASSQHDWQIRL